MLVPKLRFKREDGSEYPEWNSKSFSETFSPLNNNTFSRDMLSEIGSVCNIHYGDILVKYGEVCDIQKESIPKVNDDIGTGKYDLLQDGDVILADTAEDETVGKATEILNVGTVKVVSGLHTMACRPNEKYAPKYLGYYINSPTYHKQLIPFMQGIKVTSIGRKNISETVIHFPSDTEEQQKIADFLSAVDEVIAQSEAEVQNLEQQKKAAMQKIFSQEVRFKREDGTDYPEWEETTIGEYCDILDNLRKPITKKDRKAGIYPYYGSTNIQDYVSGYIFDEPLVLLGEDAAPFMDFRNKPIAQLAIGKYWVNNHAHCLRPHGNVIFFYYSVVHKDIRDYINNPERAKLNQEDMVKIPILLPYDEEQQKIADFLSAYDEAISYAKQELDKWKELKKGLLQQMFV